MSRYLTNEKYRAKMWSNRALFYSTVWWMFAFIIIHTCAIAILMRSNATVSLKVCIAAKWYVSLSLTFSMNGRGSISICDTGERTVMRNSDCIQMRNFESRNALRLKTAFHSIRWIARIINVVTVVHDIQSAETINLRPFNVVQGCWVRVRQDDSYIQLCMAPTLWQFVTSACRVHLTVHFVLLLFLHWIYMLHNFV